MSGWMTTEQMYGWKIMLELKLRRASGVAFQDFFSDVMEEAYGDDFRPTRPRGSLGDKGCDGYLASVGRVFACYGKQDDASPSVPVILAKMDEDYAKACRHLAAQMKEWHFVHNMMDGGPTDATVIRLQEMEAANPAHRFGTFGKATFEKTIFSLPEASIILLIGPAVSAEDTRNMRIEEVKDLVDGIVAAVEATPFAPYEVPKEVPEQKMEFNAIPNHWRHTLTSQMANAKHVGAYFRGHRDPERGVMVASVFKSRYRSLKAQGLAPGEIMAALHEAIVGVGTATNERNVAAFAILAYLFDACDIFEDKPLAQHSSAFEAAS